MCMCVCLLWGGGDTRISSCAAPRPACALVAASSARRRLLGMLRQAGGQAGLAGGEGLGRAIRTPDRREDSFPHAQTNGQAEAGEAQAEVVR